MCSWERGEAKIARSAATATPVLRSGKARVPFADPFGRPAFDARFGGPTIRRPLARVLQDFSAICSVRLYF